MDVDHKNGSAMNGVGGGENFSSNATDVTDLQREKAQVELQMLRLKSNINAIEFQLNHNERVSQIPFFLFEGKNTENIKKFNEMAKKKSDKNLIYVI